jgi:23S rRNA (guanosine2251-2'-O)-methyltransferase
VKDQQIIFGLHAVEALLLKQPERILHVYLGERQDQKLQKILQTLSACSISYEVVARETLDRLSQQGNHQGVLACCSPPKTYTENELKDLLTSVTVPPLLLILDGVQDPHNLGACLRTADAAGVHAVIAPKDRSVGLTSAVVKVACGAAETVPFVQVTNLARVLLWLKEQGIWLFGMAEGAVKTIYDEKFNMPTAFILGNEEKGLRHLTREHCDVLLKIPMNGFVSSLNVSAATAICLYEAVRQRG